MLISDFLKPNLDQTSPNQDGGTVQRASFTYWREDLLARQCIIVAQRVQKHCISVQKPDLSTLDGNRQTTLPIALAPIGVDCRRSGLGNP
jgi:hypothetical protein